MSETPDLTNKPDTRHTLLSHCLSVLAFRILLRACFVIVNLFVLIMHTNLLFVDAGRKSAAAERELSVDGQKEIYPLLINRYLAMDFGSEEQVLGGKSAARVLTAVRGSKNDRFDIGWRTAGESEDGVFGEKELRQDLMIVINLHKSWSKVVADPDHWERIYIGEMYREADQIMKESANQKHEPRSPSPATNPINIYAELLCSI